MIIGSDDSVAMPKVPSEADKDLFYVTSDNSIRCADDVIKQLGVEKKWHLARNPDKIPMTIQPFRTFVRARPLGTDMAAEKIYSNVEKAVTFTEWAAFGARYPAEQLTAPHILIWRDASGRLYYGSLHVHNGCRDLDVDECGPDYVFLSCCVVLERV